MVQTPRLVLAREKLQHHMQLMHSGKSVAVGAAAFWERRELDMNLQAETVVHEYKTAECLNNANLILQQIAQPSSHWGARLTRLSDRQQAVFAQTPSRFPRDLLEPRPPRLGLKLVLPSQVRSMWRWLRGLWADGKTSDRTIRPARSVLRKVGTMLRFTNYYCRKSSQTAIAKSKLAILIGAEETWRAVQGWDGGAIGSSSSVLFIKSPPCHALRSSPCGVWEP